MALQEAPYWPYRLFSGSWPLSPYYDLLKEKMPMYASIGLLIAIYGCVSGINFGFVGVFSEVFRIDHVTYLKAAADHPLSFNLLLFWSGPLFPLSLLV